jgi:phosphoglycerate dehydrogenase-like enzyme
MIGKQFNVMLTGDFYDASGAPKYADLGLGVFEGHPEIAVKSFAEHRKAIGADQLAGANGVIVLTPAVTGETVSDAGNLLAIGRFGVGYDTVDVAACTSADVVAFITAGAVDRPVAEAVVGWMIALTHNVMIKDRLVRQGKWDERSQHMGRELRDRTLGVIGLGGIARKLIELLSGWGMNPPLAFDPFMKPEAAEKLGVKLVSLDELLKSSDFVSIHCPLTEQTLGLIGSRELSLMKANAYLINSARGGIVDEDALYAVLKGRKIAGAALDCFAVEPVVQPSRFGDLDNVLLAPHSIAWTNELFRDIGRAACQGMLDLAQQRKPRGVLNPEVFDRPGFQDKWSRICQSIR